MSNQINNLVSRPPIVVVMGHIDHGKSKLLDYIRNTNVVEKEVGGITQHIGAYETTHPRITFLDTPGHEAFSQMRLRGAKVADVAILVIAADEGVKPQTLEAYEAIKKAGIPFVIALNKIDKPNADPERVKAQLAENQIFVEGYGGKIPTVNISAKFGQGIDELLEMVLLLAEMENLRANSGENASGFVIESRLGARRGISATLLIQNGTMKKGMFVVSGNAMAPVRIFEDFQGRPLEEATFSAPVRIIGFNNLPSVGSEFKSFDSKKEAEDAIIKVEPLQIAKVQPLEEQPLEEGKIIIPLIIKADVIGSLEALEQEIKKLENKEVVINILRKDTGKITEDDIKFASSAENAIVLGFNVAVDSSARTLAERFEVLIFTSDIIYKISEWLEEEIKKKEEIKKEEIIGTAKILKIFSQEKNKWLIGGNVISGKIIEGVKFKLKRNGEEISEGKIISLQQFKTPVKEVSEGNEFGAMVESKIDLIKDDEIIFCG